MRPITAHDFCDTCGENQADLFLTPDDPEDTWPICDTCFQRLKRILLNAAHERGISLEEVLDET